MAGLPPRVIGRYLVGPAIASGGMATVHLGRLLGPAGFSRTVAIKQLRPLLAADADLSAMLLDEARLASRVRHPNVVAPLDVIVFGEETFIVMEYVHGESLARVWKLISGAPLPIPIATAIIGQVLLGLHAAHRALGEDGQLLNLVHRDVSPQNIMLASDGVARLLDFGVAKAESRAQQTEHGMVKGKLGYMAPEQVAMLPVDARTDVFAAGVVLWELLTGERLFLADTPAGTIEKMSTLEVPPPSERCPAVPPALDAVVARAVSRDAAARFDDAHAMAVALAAAAESASMIELGAWVDSVAGEALRQRAERLSDFEALPLSDLTVGLPPARPVGGSAPDSAPTPASSSALSLVAVASPPRRESKLMTTAALLTVLAVAVAGVGLFRREQRPPVRAAVAEPLPPVVASVSPALPPGPNAAPALVELQSAAPPEPLAPSLWREPPPQPSVRASRSRVNAARSEKSAGRCAIPYSIDQHGVKRFDPECF